MTDPGIQNAMNLHTLVEGALTGKVLPPADFDQRTLTAVLEIVEREAVKRPWANEVKLVRRLGEIIARELGHAR